MIDAYLPALRWPSVSSLAREIRDNQLSEISELEAELRRR